jgi:NAD(P)-dependent dehydrogenase (short-subunit alcohol dehydrogenase family)
LTLQYLPGAFTIERKKDAEFMRIDLTGRTALVTGGSLGIGRAIAERMGRSGASVVIVARRRELVDQTVRELSDVTQGRVFGFVCDVSDTGQIDKTFAAIEGRVGGIDILVNNAGATMRSPLLQLTRDLVDADLNLKFHAALRLSQLVIPQMRAKQWGRILNIVTVAAKTPSAASGPTTFSRAAGMALLKSMSKEFAADNVLVNGLCIGLVKSDQWVREHRERFSHMEFGDYLAQKARDNAIPLGRLGEAEEVANVACFLASDAASYVTGTVVNIDGGKCPII